MVGFSDFEQQPESQCVCLVLQNSWYYSSMNQLCTGSENLLVDLVLSISIKHVWRHGATRFWTQNQKCHHTSFHSLTLTFELISTHLNSTQFNSAIPFEQLYCRHSSISVHFYAIDMLRILAPFRFSRKLITSVNGWRLYFHQIFATWTYFGWWNVHDGWVTFTDHRCTPYINTIWY